MKAKRDVRRGDTDREFLEAIREHQADLVVVGAHGIGQRMPIGSKAERHSDTPVLLIREAK